MLRLLTPFVLLLAVLAAAWSFDERLPRADFTFANRYEVFTLDPQRMSWMQDFRMAGALYESLLRWDNQSFEILPAAADLPEISADGRTYTFRIRPEVRWSSGDPVTAHDFLYAWRRALLPDTAADYSSMFFLIEGGEEFFHWRSEQATAFQRAALSTGERGTTRGDEARRLWDEAEQRFEATVAARALDDRTLQVTLRRPTAYFLDLIAFAPWSPVHRPTVEGWQLDDEAKAACRASGWHTIAPPPWEQRRWVNLNESTGKLEQKNDWTHPPHLVGNGPYVLSRWRYQRELRLERNPSFHDPARAKCDTIAVMSIADPNTAVLAFETGAIDWLSDVGVNYQADMLEECAAYAQRHATELASLLAQGRTRDEALAALPAPQRGERRNLHAIPAFGADFFSFNCRAALADGRPNPFADARVRRAFAMSVDKQAIVERVTRLHEPVMNVFIPPGSIAGYRSPPGLAFDPLAARAELRAAGWEDRDGDGALDNGRGEAFPEVDLLYSSNSPRYKDMALALRAMWQGGLGVRVELRGKESKFFKEDLKNGNFMIGRGNWYGDYGDPTTFLDIFRSGDGNNDRGFSDPHVDGLLDQAAGERDPARRMEILAECERVLFEEHLPMVVICQPVQLYMYEPDRVNGLSTHPRLAQDLGRIETSKRRNVQTIRSPHAILTRQSLIR